MAVLSKVYNDGVIDYTEKMDGTEITIPAKGYIEMSRREAIKLRSAHPGHYTDGPNRGRPIEKPLRVVHGEEEEVQMYVNQQTGQVYNTQEELDASLSAGNSVDKLAQVLASKLGGEATTTKPEKVYVCPECDKEFSGTGAKMILGNHMKGHKSDISRTPGDN